MTHEKNAPDFFIIGAQKSATTWLWKMLEQHPDTSLPKQKEIHYFGSAELHAKGDEWYYSFFEGLDQKKLIGEASTTYFYDHIPYWHNKSDQIEFDSSLPTIPTLINSKFPDAKFLVVLRDPVQRAISAYAHWMKRGELSPRLGLKAVATSLPKMRIVEYGYYAKYLKTWMDIIPEDRFRVIIFEDQIKKNWDVTLTNIYEYLGLDASFQPKQPNISIHESWGWTRIVFNYYARKISPKIVNDRFGRALERFDFLSSKFFNREDIEFLRSVYLPERDEIATLVGNDLKSWDYGEKLLGD